MKAVARAIWVVAATCCGLAACEAPDRDARSGDAYGTESGAAIDRDGFHAPTGHTVVDNARAAAALPADDSDFELVRKFFFRAD